MKIELKNVTKIFDRAVISNFNKTFSGSGMHVILGESGGGKSTLLKLIAGVWQPDFGSVCVTPGAKISFIFQEDRLLPWITAGKNVLAVNNNKALCSELFDLLGLSGMDTLYPHQMSGGMKRRVAIIRALLYDGDIFVMDEAFSGIDYKRKLDIIDIMNKRLKYKLSIAVTHDYSEAELLGGNVYNLTVDGLSQIKNCNIKQ